MKHHTLIFSLLYEHGNKGTFDTGFKFYLHIWELGFGMYS